MSWQNHTLPMLNDANSSGNKINNEYIITLLRPVFMTFRGSAVATRGVYPGVMYRVAALCISVIFNENNGNSGNSGNYGNDIFLR